MNEIEKAIDILRKYSVKNAIVKDSEYESFNLAISALTEKLNGGWVKCEDELPEESGKYLISIKGYLLDNYTQIARFGKTNEETKAWKGAQGNCFFIDVIAWKPITPYQPTDTVN